MAQPGTAALDSELDAALARLTGPGGLFKMGVALRHGVAMPCIVNAPPTLPAFFATYCAHYGDRPFLIDGDERLSFVQTHDAARQAAGGLIAGHGVRPGDHVGLAACNGSGWIIAYMAILMAGGVACLINCFWTAKEMAEAVADSGCRLVIADDRRHAMLEPLLDADGALVRIRLAVPVAEGLAALRDKGGDATVPLPDVAPQDDATILFTSGSTGRSKGAVSDQRAKVQGALNFAGATICMLDVITRRGDPPTHLPATLLNVPLFHVTAEVSVLLHSFAIGRKLVLMAKWDAEAAMRLIAREQVTYFVGVPLMSHEIATHPRRGDYDLSTVKDMASGGAPRPPEQVKRIADNMPHAHPVIGYGLTETNAVGAGNFREAYLAKPRSTGRATQPLSEIAILDPQGRRVSVGENGEIAIRSIANIGSYWGQPQDSAALFTADGYVRTGDLGYLDDDGYLFIVDRLKDIIIRGGENIPSADIEAALYAHPAVVECAVFGQTHDRYGEVPVAVVHLRAASDIDAAGLCAYLKSAIAAFKLPERIWISDMPLPRLGTEKIDKRAVKAAYSAAK